MATVDLYLYGAHVVVGAEGRQERYVTALKSLAVGTSLVKTPATLSVRVTEGSGNRPFEGLSVGVENAPDTLTLRLPPETPFPVFLHLLSYSLRERLSPTSDTLLMLHAAAFGYASRATVLTGLPGSGKTTMLSAFLDAGAPFLAEDTAQVEPASLQVLPALPMKVMPLTVGHAAQACAVVELRYRPDEPLSVTRLERGDALVALANASFNVKALGSAGLKALAALSLRPGVHRITYPNADTGERAINEVLLSSLRADGE